MRTHTDKAQEGKIQSVANESSQKQRNGKSTFQFFDNRSEAIAQRRLEEMANNSPQAKQLRAFHKMPNSYLMKQGAGFVDNRSNALVQQRFQNRVDTIQRCFLCGDKKCKKGEKCGKDETFGGLFNRKQVQLPVKFYNQKQGHGGKPREWEHVVPGKAYALNKRKNEYKKAPVISISKSIHRGKKGVLGNRISSTGSYAGAKVWSKGLGDMMGKGDFSGAFLKGFNDALNVALHNGEDLMVFAQGYIKVLNGHVMNGQIPKSDVSVIKQKMMNTVLNMQTRPGLYGNK